MTYVTQPPTADACNFDDALIGSVHITLRVGGLTLDTIKGTDTLYPSYILSYFDTLTLETSSILPFLPALSISPTKEKENQIKNRFELFA